MTVIDWLLDSDPAIRWQVMRDLQGAPAAEVAVERARVANEGWGARILDLQGADGNWDGGTFFPDWYTGEGPQPWTATAHTLGLLRHLGPDPANERVQHAIALVRDNSRWEAIPQLFFEGETEECINGLATAIGAYFDQDVRSIVDRLLGERLDDGGWNCETEFGSVRSSFASTINVLEGLLEFEWETGGSPAVTEARASAEEYLLERHLFRRLTTGEVPDPRWLEPTFPTFWRYDVLRALDYFRSTGQRPDNRCAEAVDVVRSARADDGRWPLLWSMPGAVHFRMEDGAGEPSRWVTLKALRVLRWYDDGVGPLADDSEPEVAARPY